jgi:hypothetical protein
MKRVVYRTGHVQYCELGSHRAGHWATRVVAADTGERREGTSCTQYTINHPGELGWLHRVIPLFSRKPPSNSVEIRALHYVAGPRAHNLCVLSVHSHTAQVLCIRLGLVLKITFNYVALNRSLTSLFKPFHNILNLIDYFLHTRIGMQHQHR